MIYCKEIIIIDSFFMMGLLVSFVLLVFLKEQTQTVETAAVSKEIQ